jgi:hypothetical protein
MELSIMSRLEASTILRAAGMSLFTKDGEYRVNFTGGREATAYYTTDLLDAVQTGIAMRTQRHKPTAA